MVSRIALGLARRVAGRLVSAGEHLQDGIWQYGTPSRLGPSPRTRTSKRRGLLTYVEQDTLGPAVEPSEGGLDKDTQVDPVATRPDAAPAGARTTVDDAPGFMGDTEDTLPGETTIEDILDEEPQDDPLHGLRDPSPTRLDLD